MKRMKNILAFTIAIIMVLSTMTFVSFASSEENSLPIGTYVVSSEWKNMEEMEEITCVLGGREYILEYGVTAASSIEEALALPRPVGMKPTIVLAPGRYGDMTISSNINLAGPYFGLAPFNNPRKADIYDPEIEDMAVINGRSLDASKEAVLTGKITIADGCTELEIDGIAMSGGAQITDSGRSMNNAVGAFTFHAKNIYGRDTSNTLFAFNGGSAISRYLYFTDCYFNNVAGRAMNPTAEVIELDGFCFDGGKPAIYRILYDPSTVVTKNTESFFNVYNSCFRNVDSNGMLNQALGENNTTNPGQRDTIHMNVINNYFQDIGDMSNSGGAWNIRPQLASSNHSYVLKNNVFKAVTKPASVPIHFYKQTGSPMAKCVIEDNIYINTNYPTRGNSIAPVDISRNFFCDSSGVRNNPKVDSGVTYNGYYYDESLSVGTFDFNITDSNVGGVACKTIVNGTATWTATVYCEEGVFAPTFTFEKDDVQATLYSNSACTQQLSEIDTSLFTSGEMTAYLMVERLGYTEKYTVKFTTAASTLRDIISIENATLDKANTSAVITVPYRTNEFVLPTVDDGVVLSKGAEIEYYADPLQLEKISSVNFTEEELPTVYAKVIAANGEYDVWSIDFFMKTPDVVIEGASDQCELVDFDVPGAKDVFVEDGFISVELKDDATKFEPVVSVSKGATYGFYADVEGTITSKQNTKFEINSAFVSSYLIITAEDGMSQNVYAVSIASNRSSTRYTDTNKISAYAKNAVAKLNDSGYGIFVGDEKGRFNPLNNITRYEVAVIMTKLCGINVELMESVDVSYVFADYNKIPSWALPYVKASYVSGLISGTTQLDGTVRFDGSANTTREQFITILMRAITSVSLGISIDEIYAAQELQIETAFVKANVYDENDFSSYAAKAIKIAIAFDLVNGAPYKDGVKVNPKQPITRQDVAVILSNLLFNVI